MLYPKLASLLTCFLLIVGVAKAQQPVQGSYEFGKNAVILLNPSDAGYSDFVSQVDNYTNGTSVNWSGLATAIQNVNGLGSISQWIATNSSSLSAESEYVLLFCCVDPDCVTHVPYTCEGDCGPCQ